MSSGELSRVYPLWVGLQKAKRPRLIHKPNSPLASFLLRHCPLLSEVYRPTIWCSGAKVQSAVASVFKRTLPISYRRELLETPDGGQIALDWHGDTAGERRPRPTVLILPGFSSSSRQNYITHMVAKVAQKGYRAVVFNNRGLGGVALKTHKTFCAANTEDLAFVISSVRKVEPKIPLLAVGVCFGGMCLKNYLVDFGNQGKDTGLVGAMAISSPWSLVRMMEVLCGADASLHNVTLDRFLTRQLHRLIRRNRAILEKHSNTPELSSVASCLRQETSSVREFDHYFTAPIFGFESVDSYYRAASLDTKPIRTINIPLLCLCAEDDPLIPEDSIPCDAIRASPNVVLALTAQGGHIWFSEGFSVRGPGYADRLVGQYVEAMFEGQSN